MKNLETTKNWLTDTPKEFLAENKRSRTTGSLAPVRYEIL